MARTRSRPRWPATRWAGSSATPALRPHRTDQSDPITVADGVRIVLVSRLRDARTGPFRAAGTLGPSGPTCAAV
jgi:hypothetical protein